MHIYSQCTLITFHELLLRFEDDTDKH